MITIVAGGGMGEAGKFTDFFSEMFRNTLCRLSDLFVKQIGTSVSGNYILSALVAKTGLLKFSA